MNGHRLVPIAAIALAAPVLGWQGQSDARPDSPRIAAVLRDAQSGRTSAQDSFWKEVESAGSPILERVSGTDQVLATFVWKDPGDTQSVLLNARINSADPMIDPRNRMVKLAGTDIWYLSHRFPADAEFLYQLAVNAPDASRGSAGAAQRALRPDPFNQHPYPDKSDPMFDPVQLWRDGSIAAMPAVLANPWLVKKEGVATGTLRKITVSSSFLKLANPRTVWVYRSPGAELRSPNVLILFDGGTTYQVRIPTTTILDNLFAAGRIGQTVALFVDNGGEARASDLPFNDAFVSFLTDELLPAVEHDFKFQREATRTVIGGDSLGGLMGAYAALKRPDVFGKVLSQSGAFQFNNENVVDRTEPEWLARQFGATSTRGVFFHLDVGLMEDRPEGGEGTTLLASNRHLRDVLKAKGFGVHYVEVYADHDPVHWRRTLPDALMATLGP